MLEGIKKDGILFSMNLEDELAEVVRKYISDNYTYDHADVDFDNMEMVCWLDENETMPLIIKLPLVDCDYGKDEIEGDDDLSA